jgi:hypothetical protein
LKHRQTNSSEAGRIHCIERNPRHESPITVCLSKWVFRRQSMQGTPYIKTLVQPP